MVRVSVVVVNFNGARLLDDCLCSLSQQIYRSFEVVFVDNGSTDDSLSKARRLLPGIRCVPLSENRGFAGGANAGIRAACGEHVILLNNDTLVAPDFLEELVLAADQNPRIGMVAPKILNYSDRTLIDSVGGLLLCRQGKALGRGRGERDHGQYDKIHEVLMPCGCAALYKRALFEDVGLLDERFFAYCEDSDLGLRARWAGWEAVSAPRAVVYHKYSATAGSRSSLKMYLTERNHYWLALKNYPLRLLLILPAVESYRCLLMAYALLCRKGMGAVDHRLPLFWAFLRGNVDALCGVLTALKDRPRRRTIAPREMCRLLRTHRLSLAKMLLDNW